MFGKNNKQKSEEPQSIGFPGFVEELIEPKVDLEVDVKTLEKEEVVPKEEPKQEVPQIQPVQPIQVIKEPIKPVEKTPKHQAKIITGEALENGLYRSTIISTKSLGEVGTIYEV